MLHVKTWLSTLAIVYLLWGVVAQWLECRFETWTSSFTPQCLGLSGDTLTAVGPFYLVSMPGEV